MEIGSQIPLGCAIKRMIPHICRLKFIFRSCMLKRKLLPDIVLFLLKRYSGLITGAFNLLCDKLA